jgi:hypothetical protein
MRRRRDELAPFPVRFAMTETLVRPDIGPDHREKLHYKRNNKPLHKLLTHRIQAIEIM